MAITDTDKQDLKIWLSRIFSEDFLLRDSTGVENKYCNVSQCKKNYEIFSNMTIDTEEKYERAKKEFDVANEVMQSTITELTKKVRLLDDSLTTEQAEAKAIEIMNECNVSSNNYNTFNQYYTLLNNKVNTVNKTASGTGEATSTTTPAGSTEGKDGYTGKDNIKYSTETSATISGSYNFFKMYNLNESTNNSGFGFIPIYLQSSTWKSDESADNGWYNDSVDSQADNQIKFILPMPGDIDINERVNIGIDARDASAVNQAIGGIASAGMKMLGVGGAGELAGHIVNSSALWSASGISTMALVEERLYQQKIASGNGSFADQWLINYNPLKTERNIQLEFILPITDKLEIDSSEGLKTWFIDVKKGLGALIGQAYPRSATNMSPLLFRLKVGNLYNGFKGYISDISITFSKEQVTLGDYYVPLIIKGTIGFKSIALYTWLEGANNPEYTLGTNPALIFGSAEPNTTTTSSNSVASQKDNTGKKDEDLDEIYKNYDPTTNTDDDDYDERKTVDDATATAAKNLDGADETIEENQSTWEKFYYNKMSITTKKNSETTLSASDLTTESAVKKYMNSNSDTKTLSSKGVLSTVLDTVCTTVTKGVGAITSLVTAPLKLLGGTTGDGTGSTLIRSIFNKDGTFNVSNINKYSSLFKAISNGDVSGIFSNLSGVLNMYNKEAGTSAAKLNTVYQNGRNVISNIQNFNSNSFGSTAESINNVLSSLIKLSGSK